MRVWVNDITYPSLTSFKLVRSIYLMYPWESTQESRALHSSNSCTITEWPSAQARCSAVRSKLSFASISILREVIGNSKVVRLNYI